MCNFSINNCEDEGSCPRCGAGRLRAWSELSDEEQGVVRRLPGAADYTFAERAGRHLWCTRCFYEAAERSPRNV